MTFTRKSRLIGYSALSTVLLLTTGCMVGPKYKAPAPPQITGYTPVPVTATSATPNVAGGEAQKFVEGQDIPGEWWTVFHSKPLDDLIERSLKANPDIKAAQAALLVARENVLAQRGAYFPSASAGFSADHSKTSNVVSPFTASGALTSARVLAEESQRVVGSHLAAALQELRCREVEDVGFLLLNDFPNFVDKLGFKQLDDCSLLVRRQNREDVRGLSRRHLANQLRDTLFLEGKDDVALNRGIDLLQRVRPSAKTRGA